MDLTTVDRLRTAFYRLTGVLPEDGAITEHGAGDHDLAYEYLTSGMRSAQRWMLENGYYGWLRTSEPLVFEGSDEQDGGRFAPLPADFLMAFGNERMSALTLPNGTRWGREVDGKNPSPNGRVYWIPNTAQVWVGKQAAPPPDLRIQYHWRHPALEDGTEIEFPMEARRLIPALAAQWAREDEWVPGGEEAGQRIERAVRMAQSQARRVARTTRQPRKMEPPRRYGNRW